MNDRFEAYGQWVVRRRLWASLFLLFVTTLSGIEHSMQT